MQIHIRWMIRRDMAEVLDIENKCFDDPWTEEEFIKCLQERNCIGMVAEIGTETNDIVTGYMIYELNLNQITILNFAVDPKYQRQNVGKQMIDRLVGKLSQHRRRKLITEVRETNLNAQLFFKDMGFQLTEIIPNSYKNIQEDGYVMEYRIKTVHEDILSMLQKRQFSNLLYE